MKKVVIVGAGASGILFAVNLSNKHKDYEIILIDKNDKLGKKLRATGNGRANIFNLGDIKGKYSNEIAATTLFKEINPIYLTNYFKSIGIEVISYGDYVYPYSESSNCFTDSLIKILIKNKVNIVNNTKAIDYNKNTLFTDNGNYTFDYLVIASGLGSNPKLGSDALFIYNLNKHGYKINKIIPSLVAIKTIESTKEVDGIRRKVNVKIIDDNQVKFSEDGELIFKKDGLSGIVIFNASSYLLRNQIKNPNILIDFLPNTNFNGNLSSYFQDKLVKYLSKYSDPKKVIFHLKGYYGIDDSICSIGGVSINNVNDNFKSKIEDNVYIIGEALNQDGVCGGFNLMWAFSTALKSSNNM